MNILDALKERGMVKQVVYESELYELFGKESVSFYVGFDPTADSLHVGHFLTLMAMARLQQAGHKPYILLGGGTGMIGDPSGRTDMRGFMGLETIDHNIECFRKQTSKFLSFEGSNAAVMVNNADWLRNLNYVDFLREVGSQFSVNKMLTADCFKSRMEKGLSFMEFNYMIMQAYDFLTLFRTRDVRLQCGGDDQWSNILAGADLIRRKEREPAFALTFPLLTTTDGTKMGKTQKGALWLDANKTPPYDFYQYFRNVDDPDVANCLKFLTFLPVAEINELTKFNDERMNAAKERLAYEVTKLVHGETEAQKCQREARAAFGGGGEMPTATISKGVLKIADILVELKQAKSKTEAKQLILGGGIKIDDKIIAHIDDELTEANVKNGFVLHKGKKVHIKVTSNK
jgi:tyrosyl-tRNA synthetase